MMPYYYQMSGWFLAGKELTKIEAAAFFHGQRY